MYENQVTWTGKWQMYGTTGITWLETCAGILEQSTGARNRVGIGLSYRLDRLEESIPGLLKRLEIRALAS
jgi:hypothetical protein